MSTIREHLGRTDNPALNDDGIPHVEMITSSSSWTPEIWDLPDRPADDVWAVRMRCHPHSIWERSRANPSMWFNAANGTMRSWRKLVAEYAPLIRHEFNTTVYVVRPDGMVPDITIYSCEAAAVGAAGTDRRVHPWAVQTRPVDNRVD